MKVKFASAVTTLAIATAATGQSTTAPGAQPSSSVTAVSPVYTQSMEKLQQAAQRLRESIQAMAQKKHGAERDLAIGQAHEALLETQRAMLALPPEVRSTGTVSAVNYDESVKKLMKAADSLREAVQAMAQQPAGEGRNRAIEQANQALWDTQVAMVSAYDPGRSDARTMGAGTQPSK